jgi:hypothetical protein
MIRKVIGLLLIVGAFLGAKRLVEYYGEVQHRQAVLARGGVPDAPLPPPGFLAGLPPSLETSLQEAQKQGAASLKNWLQTYRPYVRDPRLAAIELDYVVLLGAKNLPEARQVFEAVQQRTPTNSPIYLRVRQLEKTYR